MNTLPIRQLIHDIRHERAEGIHTYHDCPCGRGRTRRGKCASCLEDELVGLCGGNGDDIVYYLAEIHKSTRTIEEILQGIKEEA